MANTRIYPALVAGKGGGVGGGRVDQGPFLLVDRLDSWRCCYRDPRFPMGNYDIPDVGRVGMEAGLCCVTHYKQAPNTHTWHYCFSIAGGGDQTATE